MGKENQCNKAVLKTDLKENPDNETGNKLSVILHFTLIWALCNIIFILILYRFLCFGFKDIMKILSRQNL